MRLNQIARKLGVSTDTIIGFLKKKDASVNYKPNTKLTQTSLTLLIQGLPEGKQLQREKSPSFQKASTGMQNKQQAKVKEATPKPLKAEPRRDPIPTPPQASAQAKPLKIPTYTPSPRTFTPIRIIKLPEKKTGTKVLRKRIPKTVSSAPKFPRSPFKPGKPGEKPFGRPSFQRPNFPCRGSQRRKKKRTKRHVEELNLPEVIKIVPFSTVKELALLFDMPLTDLVQMYGDLDIKVSPSQRMEAKLITLVAEELDKNIEIVDLGGGDSDPVKPVAEEDLEPKIPVVVTMGHVDHGKTSLLDYIKKSNVTQHEAGNITQHVGAYQIKTAEGRDMTFLDTPGHQAFTAMRALSTHVADVAIIVIAANDGIMPQTKEAIHHAQLMGVPIVFAFNKIDLPSANLDQLREQLAAMQITVEDWGGNHQCQAISAKTGEGVDNLLEKVLLEADILKLSSQKEGMAQGVVLESTMKKGQGFLVTGIIQKGTLKQRDIVVAGSFFGKIKAIFTSEGASIKEATPAMPVQLLGIGGAPSSGEPFRVVATEQEARKIAGNYQGVVQEQKLRAKKGNVVKNFEKIMLGSTTAEPMHMLLKGDTHGSIGALADSLIGLSNDEVEVNIVHKAVGNITESDVMLAAASGALIIGFQTKIDKKAAVMMEKEGVEAKIYRIIYEAIDEVKERIASGGKPIEEEVVLGEADVVRVFNISRVGKVAGCIVKKGIIKRSAMMHIIRNEEQVYTGKITQLKREKETIKEAKKNSECGISTGDFEVQEGDIVRCFEIKEKIR